MSTTATASPARIGRTILLALGLVAIAFGITILFWPTKTAIALTGLIAFQAASATSCSASSTPAPASSPSRSCKGPRSSSPSSSSS